MRKAKYVLDALMAAAFLLLMDTSVTGLAVHEWLGIALCAVFVLHKALNWKWIVNTTRRFGALSARVRFMYVLDAVLLVMMSALLLSGLLISRVVLPQTVTRAGWALAHGILSWGTLALLGVHVGLHWKAILLQVRKLLHLRAYSTVRTVLCRVVSGLLALLGIYGLVRTSSRMLSQTLAVAGGTSRSSTAGDGSAQQADTPVLAAQRSAHSQAKGNDRPGAQSQTVNDYSDDPELENYLSTLTCSGCGKRCSLANPHCGRGVQQQTEAAQAYRKETGGQNTADDAQASPAPSATPVPADSQTQDDKKGGSASVESGSATDSTLQNYLGSLFCDGCGRHCPLSAPQCSVGSSAQQQAIEQYTAGNTDAAAQAAQALTTPAQAESVDMLWQALGIMGLFVSGTYYITEAAQRYRTQKDKI
ncbi:MAG: DUF4405 domain-containing protein [Eubacteriales bacterium]|nr:DUF4405 domain-containing protein [Eubacteriales bacterium]